ncbi:class I SAM-dependent methyltransferase [Methylobrevis pamukkalensis]|uniref:Putative methyltransferase YcgJ n=1 Tax=Methylobrevis pamukkalensis TaxID=1439726 RepID=A0A1E3GXQ2_9HYPH|nr:class I SAM-dependent methyltransferase [Methylobrevis pamukkalensis]ODN68705.1 putative methyltransferase YcgJ [Methylobrevis pamukkalensis]
MTTTQNRLIDRQFGPMAAAYVESRVHAAGADLDLIAARAAEVRPSVALDLGTGGGHVAYALAPHAGEVLACDLSAGMLATVARTAAEKGLANIRTVEADVRALGLDAATADFVASRYSAHHWTDLAAGLREARRVAKAGAPAIFADVVTSGVALYDTHLQAVELLRDPSHVRNRSIAEWTALLRDAGFETLAVRRDRLRLDFATWIARMGTPEAHVTAIRSLQEGASAEVRRHFAIEPDGSFLLETAVFETVAD